MDRRESDMEEERGRRGEDVRLDSFIHPFLCVLDGSISHKHSS